MSSLPWSIRHPHPGRRPIMYSFRLRSSEISWLGSSGHVSRPARSFSFSPAVRACAHTHTPAVPYLHALSLRIPTPTTQFCFQPILFVPSAPRDILYYPRSYLRRPILSTAAQQSTYTPSLSRSPSPHCYVVSVIKLLADHQPAKVFSARRREGGVLVAIAPSSYRCSGVSCAGGGGGVGIDVTTPYVAEGS